MKKTQEAQTTQRQTARIGEGKGRQKEVRGSAIYAVSGALPPGDVKVKAPASLGQRRRPATSKKGATTLVTRVRAGGRMAAALVRTLPKRETAHRRIAPLLVEMPRSIPIEDWPTFLDDFSVLHEGQIAEIETFQPDQTSRIHAHDLPLEGVMVDLSPDSATASIIIGGKPSYHITHTINRTTRITALNENEIEVESADRSRSILRCRKAAPKDRRPAEGKAK